MNQVLYVSACIVCAKILEATPTFICNAYFYMQLMHLFEELEIEGYGLLSRYVAIKAVELEDW